MKLAARNLGKFQGVAIPQYEREKLTPGIVHIGLGNFHRAHQAWYLHRLMQQGEARDWAIIGAGVRAGDARMRERLESQDYLSTLIELNAGGNRAEIIGSMIGFVPLERHHGALIRKMSDPAIRIVSLTITEGGYYIDPSTRRFDDAHPDMIHDAKNPDQPVSAFGAIIAALKLRREAGLGGFTCQSCDNIVGNGAVLREVVLGLARLSDPGLADWIGEHCSFPNSTVDCIVPATGAREIALAREFGIDDAAPVTHEHFRQWVMEDDFCAGRPDWDKAGAIFSAQVEDYEALKLRILNGGHQLIAAAADLLGHESIAASMQDRDIRGYFERTEREEIAPNVKAVPEFTPLSYLDLITKRFADPVILDTPRRVAFDGSSRQPGFLLPSVFDNLKAGRAMGGLALASAIWARYCLWEREDGSKIEPNDPFADDLHKRAQKARAAPICWLENRNIYGKLALETKFAEPFTHWLQMIYSDGLRAALRTYIAA